MIDLIIRNLDDTLIVELKRRAWHQGLPLEQSLRRILIASLEAESESDDRDLVMPPLTLGVTEQRWGVPYGALYS